MFEHDQFSRGNEGDFEIDSWLRMENETKVARVSLFSDFFREKEKKKKKRRNKSISFHPSIHPGKYEKFDIGES